MDNNNYNILKQQRVVTLKSGHLDLLPIFRLLVKKRKNIKPMRGCFYYLNFYFFLTYFFFCDF